MGILSFGFRRRSTEQREGSRHIVDLVRAELGLGDDDAVTVSQIDCGDPACAGGAETVILVMRKGERTRAAKIGKAMALVEDADTRQALDCLR